MSLEPKNTDNQEIDLSQISKKISSLIDSFLMSIFKSILFFKKNAIIVLILFVLGSGLGYFMDVTIRSYISYLTVTPNFESTDYLYQKIRTLNKRIQEKDTEFLKNTVGIKQTAAIKSVKVEPIPDIYTFVGSKEANLDLIKLMAEEGELSKIITDPITSKNYPNHFITITTNVGISKEAVLDPIMKYLEDSDYFKKIQAETVKNLDKKIVANDSIISQIDLVINTFANKKGAGNDKMVYYNENTQLNEIITTKNELVMEQANLAIKKINTDKIIKENSYSVNLQETKSVNGKQKFIFPIVFVFLFILFKLVQSFYNSQLEKYKKLQ